MNGAPVEQPDVSIIIVAYRSAADLPDCLSSIGPATRGVDHELLVVDNASPDDSGDVVRRLRPDATLLTESVNHGFGRAVNLATGHARGRYLLLVNPDARLHPGAVDALVAFADDRPDHAFYGGRVFSPSGEPDPKSCWGLPSPWSAFCYATGLSSAFRRSRLFDPTSLGRWERDSVREVGAVSGCLLLVSAEAWAAVGGFEERYFLYGE
ncbi:MAG: glycosyltransferase family 2 protein, partial [Actinomycetota bacterium]